MERLIHYMKRLHEIANELIFYHPTFILRILSNRVLLLYAAKVTFSRQLPPYTPAHKLKETR